MLAPLVRRLRRQPKHVREQVALWSAGGVTALIALVWLYHVPQQAAPIAQPGAERTQAFSQFLSEAGSQLSAVREAFSGRASGTVVTGATTSSAVNLSELREVSSTSDQTNQPADQRHTPVATTPIATAATSATTSRAPGVSRETAVEPRSVRIITIPSRNEQNTDSTATGSGTSTP